MELQLGIAKPVAEFANLCPVAVVQVLAGAKDLDFRDSGIPDLFQKNGRQPVIDKEVRGKSVIHEEMY